MARNAVGKGQSKRVVRKGRSGGPRPPDRPARVGKARAGASERQRRAIEALLAAFAHDVRTPLTGILAFSELLATSGLGERERRWTAAIKDTAEHLAALATLIIEGARAGGRALPRHEAFDLARLASALAASLTARAESNNLACEIDIAADLPRYVKGDPLQLRTAIENLLANAVKFTEHGKVGLKVAVASLAHGALRLSFTVTDSGIGMSAADVKRLFRPFSQANLDILQKFGGSGLGLVQVRRLAKAMRGNLEVESAPARGSTLRLSVVVDRAEADEAASPAFVTSEHGPQRPLNILCIEDNPYGRVVLNAILRELGHRANFAGSGEAAIEAVGRGGHDIVLMDIALAGIDGFEATRRIRALPGAASQVPVIGISGHSERADTEAALAAGMDAYLTKPISPRALADALARVQEA